MSLSPLYSLPVRRVVGTVTKERARVPVAPASTDVQPSAPVAVQPTRVDVEHLTVVDVSGELSMATVNSLVPLNPRLVAELIIQAGQRRRAELPLSTSTMRPMARAIVLSGEKRRGRELSAADESFLADYLESIGRHEQGR